MPITETEIDGLKMITCPVCRLLQHAEVPRCTNCGTALSPEEIERDRAIQAAKEARKVEQIKEQVLAELEGVIPITLAVLEAEEEEKKERVIHFNRDKAIIYFELSIQIFIVAF